MYSIWCFIPSPKLLSPQRRRDISSYDYLRLCFQNCSGEKTGKHFRHSLWKGKKRWNYLLLFKRPKFFCNFWKNTLTQLLRMLVSTLPILSNPQFHDERCSWWDIRMGELKNIFWADSWKKREIGRTLEEFYFINKKQNKNMCICRQRYRMSVFIWCYTNQTWDTTIAAGIIRTGVQLCNRKDGQVINLECGGFNKFVQTPTGVEIMD